VSELQKNKIIWRNQYTICFDLYNKRIGYHQGFIDSSDYNLLEKYKWNLDIGTHGSLRVRTKKNGKNVSMHREILGTKLEVDHINGNQLNNKRNNLRRCTRLNNSYNRKMFKNNSTGFKGVIFCKTKQKFICKIRVNKKEIYLGSFKNPVEASERYMEYSKKYHGEFSRRS
jgi:hypothetical protein